MGIYSVPNQNALQKTLDATLVQGATSLTLNENVAALFSGVSATNPGICVVDRIDSNGTATPSKREYISFTGVSGTQLTGLTRALAGSTDQEHAIGAIVEFVPDVVWAQSIKDTFEAEHNANGTHGDITATSVDTTTLTADGAITVNGTSASAASVKLYEDTDNGTNYMEIKAPAAVTANTALTLPDGAGSSGQALTTNGSGTLSWSTVSGLSSKITTSTRDLTAASGDVAYTGVGFVPTSIHFQASVDNSLFNSHGMAASDKAGMSYYYVSTTNNGLANQVAAANSVIFIATSSGNSQSAIVKSYDADGFTLTWTKTGSPTGTLRINFIAYK